MECKEFEKLIPDFINQKMNYPTLKEFSAHLDGCPECKEELTIQFLVTEGVSRLEQGSAFDLNKELNQRLIKAKNKLERNSAIITAGIMFEFIFLCVLAAFIIWILV